MGVCCFQDRVEKMLPFGCTSDETHSGADSHYPAVKSRSFLEAGMSGKGTHQVMWS